MCQHGYHLPQAHRRDDLGVLKSHGRYFAGVTSEPELVDYDLSTVAS